MSVVPIMLDRLLPSGGLDQAAVYSVLPFSPDCDGGMPMAW